jgi:hypothetical protein
MTLITSPNGPPSSLLASKPSSASPHGPPHCPPRERFRAGVPDRDCDGTLVEAYRQLMENPDNAVRERAAHDWCVLEVAVIAHESLGSPGQYGAKPDAAKLAFVRMCTHYFAHRAWLEDGQLLRDAHRLKGIPGVLIHGRLRPTSGGFTMHVVRTSHGDLREGARWCVDVPPGTHPHPLRPRRVCVLPCGAGRAAMTSTPSTNRTTPKNYGPGRSPVASVLMVVPETRVSRPPSHYSALANARVLI